MTILEGSFQGHTPSRMIGKVLPRPITWREKKKYEAIWKFDEYHENSPGEAGVDFFLSIAKPESGDSILDIGAGAGAASRAMKDKGYDVSAFDLATDGWAHKDIPISKGCIWRDYPGPAKFSYCADVMEHLPECLTSAAIANIISSVGTAYFSVCFLPDSFGSYIGEPLHLTVRPFTWWRDLFCELGEILDARDLIHNGSFLVRK